MKFHEYAQEILESTEKSFVGLELDLRFNIMDFVKAKLQETGMSKKELASKLYMKPSQLSRILNAESNLTLETVARLYAAFSYRPILTERRPIVEISRDAMSPIQHYKAHTTAQDHKRYCNSVIGL